MDLKNMKKPIYWLSIISLVSMLFLPAAAMSVQGSTLDTNLTRSGDGGGAAPIVKAKWEMNGPYSELSGTDDSDSAGAQFNAPGVWGTTTTYSVCAIVTDPDGVSDIDNVYADIYYPMDKAFHPEDSSNPDQINGGTDSLPDYGLSGCGEQYGDESRLVKLSKTDGYNLFCDSVRNNNNDLPTFYGDGEYDYNEICDADGELMKETAYVYCADRDLTWEDPAGTYKVEVFALDKAGVFSNLLVNNFEYLPLTAYELDFDSVDYGSVKLNTHKRISGDVDFGTADKPTVRNTGNTRLYMGIEQDDMGLGTTEGSYNLKYDARVGNNEEDWKNFYPYQKRWLEDILDLSQTEEMDFSILVYKFPSTDTSYTGDMTLDAKFANFRHCYDNCPSCK